MAVNSMVTGGCIVSGAYVTQSLLSTDARVEEGSRIERSVLLPGATIGRRCIIRRCIIDENCNIPDGLQIGVDSAQDRARFLVTDGGVVLVTADMMKAVA
jgi:glucose-1-phosphate adenylyltransferase